MESSEYITVENEPNPDGSLHKWSERSPISASFDHVLFSLAAVIHFGNCQSAIERVVLQEDLHEEDLEAIRTTNQIAQSRYFEPIVDLTQTPPKLGPNVLEGVSEMRGNGLWSSRPAWRIQ